MRRQYKEPAMSYPIRKYPRTPHLCGSRLQPGDEDLSQIPFSAIDGRYLVIEEKIDGANCAISFDEDGKLLIQSRGHYLRGGAKERDYDLLKQWATVHSACFYNVLGTRYIMYGEWMYVKHSVYYDALPHYFMEFDIYDRTAGIYLDTPSRKALTDRLPVCSVPVLGEGKFRRVSDVLAHLGPSHYITPDHMQSLRAFCEANGLDADVRCAETDDTTTMEGLYIKIEEGGAVVDRLKYVRPTFAQSAEISGQDWLDKAIIPNRITCTLEDLFLERIPFLDPQ